MYLAPDLVPHFRHDESIFDQCMQLEGERFRYQKGRLTQRIHIGNQSYFIKQHFGVGLRELIKNWLQFRSPVLGAKNEWLALEKLNQLGVRTPKIMAYGEKGWLPSKRQSFILMEDLSPITSLFLQNKFF